MSHSFNNPDDAFIPNIDDIHDDDNEVSRKTSSLWTHINCKDPAHPGVPVCKRCNYAFSEKTSNSSIERHLLSKYNIIVPKVAKKQTTIKFKCIDPWPAKEKAERNQAVVIWIIADQQPFSVVENANFIKMMIIFDPRYKVPDRHQIKDMVIEEFKQRRLNIVYDLQKIPRKVSFTADMWTSTLSSEAYLGLTIHYIDENWVFRQFLLDIIPFKTHHTGINMASAISDVLSEFNLIGKALVLTTDNESAMVVCGRKLSEEFEQALNNFSFNHYRCSAHILNLAIKQEMEIIDKEIIDVRKLMVKIKNSVLLCDDLRELCTMEKLEYLRPEVDIETRWNSTYYMLCKLQRMETALKMLAIKHENIRDLMPNATTWEKIEELIIVLEPLEKATKNLSASMYPTIADVRFYFTEIQDHLKYCIENDDFNQYMLADSINQKINEYWKILDDATTVTTILDSQNKTTLFESGEPTTKAINTLRDQLSLYLNQRPQLQTSLPKSSSSSREYFHQLKKRRLGTTAETTQTPASNPDFTEIERYLALPCNENVEAFLWWRAHSAEFPILSLMARDYLAIQSTSVACEQAFSVAGNTITKTRNRLHSETARASLCTKS